MDCSDYRHTRGANARNLEISNFNIQLPIITNKRELCKILKISYPIIVAKRIANKIIFTLSKRRPFVLYKPKRTIVCPHLHYKSIEELAAILRDKNYIYKEYMWDTDNFVHIKDILREHLRPKIKLDSPNFAVSHLISQYPNATMVHIRRGDFIQAGYDLLDMDYYNHAMNIVRERYPDVRFFIFGNDIKFMKSHFHSADCHIIDINGEDSVSYDFLLMSQCTHAILANSSLSAWIGNLTSGIVIYKQDSYPKLPLFRGDNFVAI